MMEIFAGFSPWQIGAALLAAFGAAFVRGMTGFGMAILLVPVLALALGPLDAVILGNFLSLFIGLVETPKLVREAERSAWRIGAIILVTTPLGLYVLSVTDAGVARLVIALIALSAFVAVIAPRRAAIAPHPLATAGVGIVSGLMTGFAGMPGPPVVPYYVGRDLPRRTTKASMLLVFTIAGFSALLAGAAMDLVDWRLGLFALALLPVILTGNRIGERASDAVADRVWRTCVVAVLGGSAVAALVRLW